jgi:DNA-binding CsgD family transcriptional regulator
MSEVEGAALGLLGRGLTPAAAAEAMALDTDEVVRLLRNACTKLGVSTPEVAIRQAAALGFFGSGSVK